MDTWLANAPPMEADKPGRAEKLQGAMAEDPVLAHLAARGMVKQQKASGEAWIVCPFESEHTSKAEPFGTVYFPAHTHGFKAGHFKCLHAHCADRTDAAYLAKIACAAGSKAEADPESLAAIAMTDLMARQFAPVRWIVRGLLPQGTMLLAGKPKSGKSWFVLGLLTAAKLRDTFLNCHIERCDSLYLALEDTDRRMQNRMTTLMVDDMSRVNELQGMEYRCAWRAGSEGAADLDEYLTAHPECRIVVVDVLAKIRPVSDRRGAYEQDYEAIASWKGVADKHAILLVIVHHTRKAEAVDVFDEVSGTLAINGAVDQIAVLKRLPEDHKRATLHMRGRDLEEDVEIGLELRSGWWNYLGSADSIAVKAERAAILDVLRDAEAPMSTAEILKATGKKSRPSLARLLSNMVKDRQIHRDGKRYAPGAAD